MKEIILTFMKCYKIIHNSWNHPHFCQRVFAKYLAFDSSEAYIVDVFLIGYFIYIDFTTLLCRFFTLNGSVVSIFFSNPPSFFFITKFFCLFCYFRRNCLLNLVTNIIYIILTYGNTCKSFYSSFSHFHSVICI